jgi:hypothetical protein
VYPILGDKVMTALCRAVPAFELAMRARRAEANMQCRGHISGFSWSGRPLSTHNSLIRGTNQYGSHIMS